MDLILQKNTPGFCKGKSRGYSVCNNKYDIDSFLLGLALKAYCVVAYKF